VRRGAKEALRSQPKQNPITREKRVKERGQREKSDEIGKKKGPNTGTARKKLEENMEGEAAKRKERRRGGAKEKRQDAVAWVRRGETKMSG